MTLFSCCIKKKRRREIVLLLVGLDNAGKTTAVKGLSKQDVQKVLPTAGFSSINLRHRGYSVTIYDLGGGPQIRDIWPRYFSEIHGVMFVIDASDMDRIIESKVELKRLLLNDKISRKPILVLANKQDKPNALDEIDIIEKLSLEPLVNAQKCPTRVEVCSFLQRDASKKMDPGLLSGYRWLLGLIIKNYNELNERVVRESLIDKNNREQVREAWRRKKGLIKDIPVQSPYQMSALGCSDKKMTTINCIANNHLPSVAKDENSSLDMVIQNGTVEVLTHYPSNSYSNSILLSTPDGRPSSSSQSTERTQMSDLSSSSSTLLVRKQLEHKSFVQRQKSFSAHVRRTKQNIPTSEPIKLQKPSGVLLPINNKVGPSKKPEQPLNQIKSNQFIELPPVRPPGSSRPMTTRSLGRTGKAWDLDLPLDVAPLTDSGSQEKVTEIF